MSFNCDSFQALTHQGDIKKLKMTVVSLHVAYVQKIGTMKIYEKWSLCQQVAESIFIIQRGKAEDDLGYRFKNLKQRSTWQRLLIMFVCVYSCFQSSICLIKSYKRHWRHVLFLWSLSPTGLLPIQDAKSEEKLSIGVQLVIPVQTLLSLQKLAWQTLTDGPMADCQLGVCPSFNFYTNLDWVHTMYNIHTKMEMANTLIIKIRCLKILVKH